MRYPASEKAEIIHDDGVRFHSERLTVPVPSVIRLRHFVRVPYQRRAPLSRRAVFLRDGGRCQYCGKKAESIDHVVPRSRGGPHTWENVVAACSRWRRWVCARATGPSSTATSTSPAR